MKQLVQKEGATELALYSPRITNDIVPNMPETVTLVKEIETTVITRERTYFALRPICGACGEVKERVIGAYFECVNEACPSHDPAPAAAIPLPAEGKNIVDVEPVEIRRAA